MPVNEVTFDVSGYPPAKNEALSMLGPRHSHRARVIALLSAAAQAVGPGFVPWTGPVGLDVELRTGPANDPWDATNYLDGIGDVLEDKSKRGPIPHLKEAGLHKEAVYVDDRLIREVHYRQRSAAEASHRVRLWLLSSDALDSTTVNGGVGLS
jgi:hypothetical protein